MPWLTSTEPVLVSGFADGSVHHVEPGFPVFVDPQEDVTLLMATNKTDRTASVKIMYGLKSDPVAVSPR